MSPDAPALPADIRDYHRWSKHAPQRYAPGPGYLDWETQPDPFRVYAGAAEFPLPLAGDGVPTLHETLHRPAAVDPAPLDLRGLAALLELSLGLAAWKSVMGERWAVRCNPSSGNLHPTEGYVLLPEIPPVREGGAGLEPGIYHYVSRDHQLEQRWKPSPVGVPIWRELLPPSCLIFGFSSVLWREAWKYGDRAYRYGQLDVGHAAAAVRYAAATLGWRARVLPEPGDGLIEALLGLDGQVESVRAPLGPFRRREAEGEHPDLLMLVGASCQEPPIGNAERLRRMADLVRRDGTWIGRPNVLSSRHANTWPVAESAPRLARKEGPGAERLWRPEPLPPLAPAPCSLTAERLIRQRRSAQRYDGTTLIPREAFFRLMDRLLPRRGVPPWDAWPWRPAVHPLILLHRVEGMIPGLYALVRRPEVLEPLREAFAADCQWRRVEGAPPHLPLYLLRSGDFQEWAEGVSCRQEIAGDGAFSLGLLAEYDAALSQGAWHYRRLFWEAGMIGQALYLNAEAEGLRGTGIGCYFDDAWHEWLGLTDERFQSLYHFTVGGPLEDNRLQNQPPYRHLKGRERL
ncbi:MAG: SagB/ThcOx family dehydrogenase [Magnetococcales bacterium]|nr:SagB/ThcOx family dehydrogenase [Magnetococcales bacterium]